MALTPPALYSALVRYRGAGVFPFQGAAFDVLAFGIASGVCQWGVGQAANLALVGAAAGGAGGGAIVTPASRIVVPVAPSVMIAALSGAGIQGALASSLAIVVSGGISDGFGIFAQYSGVSAGVGQGADVSRVVVANAPSLTGILTQTVASAAGAVGMSLPMIAQGLGVGIASLLLLGTGTAPVTGAITFPTFPATGITNSVVV